MELGNRTMHITVQHGRTLPELVCCQTCCRQYHCPFCSSNFFKSASLRSIKIHLENHFNRAVSHEGYTIHRCGLGCRRQLHYHCCYCFNTLVRRADFERHVKTCIHRSTPAPLASTSTKPTSTPAPPASIPTSTPAPLASTSTKPTSTPAPPASIPTSTPAPPASTSTKPTSTPAPPASIPTSTPAPPASTSTKPTSTPAPPASIPTSTPAPPASTSTMPASIPAPPASTSTMPTSTPAPPASTSTMPASTPALADLAPGGALRRVRLRPVQKKQCPICQLSMNVRNFKRHIERRHTKKEKDITATSHLRSECIDPKNGIYAVQKSFLGKNNPLHVQNKVWGDDQLVLCESNDCQINKELDTAMPTAEEDNVGDESYSPENPETLKRMIQYILKYKKIPSVLPEEVLHPVDHRHLIPEEMLCHHCPGNVPLRDPVLITNRAKILFQTHIVQDVSTYMKICPQCQTRYRYQEWKDGLHNFNDRIIFDIRLCITIRNMLQVHTAVSRVVEYLQLNTGVQFPSADTVLHGYLHFEALCEHEYRFSCVTCGDNPPVVIMDLHKKGAFHLSASDLAPPPADFNGEVDLESFWEALSMEQIGRGFVPSHQRNPFVVAPSFHFWAPWTGKCTRRSNIALNTEFQKIHQPKAAEASDITVTEDRLREELYKQKVKVIRTLCQECGLDSSGSRTDLLLRLSNEMKSRESYDKVFEKIWAASGGWAVIMCPCGIVYSMKCNIRAESPRDFTDLLLSWKHIPNVVIYDFARGLATHMNLRDPERLPFKPYEGRLRDPTEENITLAKKGKLKVSLPWLNFKKRVPDCDGHPTTGSAEHYALYDRFHEDNGKDSRDALRRLGLVPQLAGKVNCQVAEQLLAKMKKNNYFLNMAAPSTHLFLMRNIIHHYNEHRNKQRLNKIVNQFVM